MSPQHSGAVTAPEASSPVDVIAHAACRLFRAARVAVAVPQLPIRGHSPTHAMVQGCWTSIEPRLQGQLLVLAPGIPVGTVTAVDVDHGSCGTVSLSRSGSAVADHAGVASSAYVLCGRAEDQAGIVVLVERPAGVTAEELARSLPALVDAAAEAVTSERGTHQQRLRAGLHEREEERRRWARELHDDTLQQLGALQVLLTSTLRSTGPLAQRHGVMVQSLGTAIDMVNQQISGLRQLITELRPATLDELGLSPPLHALARRTQERTGMSVDVDVWLRYADGELSTRLVPDVEVAVYRVVQEALANASRHSGGTRARVSVVEDRGEVCVEVADDGTGIDSVSTAPGFGIVGMRERATLAGGRLEVLHGDGEGSGHRGTVVRLVVPAVHRGPEG